MNRSLPGGFHPALVLRLVLAAVTIAVWGAGSGSRAYAQRELIPTQAYSSIFAEYTMAAMATP